MMVSASSGRGPPPRHLLLAGLASFVMFQMWLFHRAYDGLEIFFGQVEESNIAYAKYRVLREENMRLKQELEDCHHPSDTGSDGSPGTEEDRSEVTVQYGPFTRQSVISDTFSNDAPHIPTLPPGEETAAVVIMACNRAEYLRRALESVLQYHEPYADQFPIYVSQDGTHKEVKAMAQSFAKLGVKYLQHIETSAPVPRNKKENVAYYRIAAHYKFALTTLFEEKGHPRVLILEDDMEVAPDLFAFFTHTAPLLEADPSLLAVSSWNDNGQTQFVRDPEAVYRSDFFPGLGWMLTRRTWDELAPIWPDSYWDDWLRLYESRRGKQSIHPEVCRTYNFGEKGSSKGQFFRNYLKPIRKNEELVDWENRDLRFLLQPAYDKYFISIVAGAKVQTLDDGVRRAKAGETVAVVYHSEKEFQLIAKATGIFNEWKDGVPRTAYEGVVMVRMGDGILIVKPANNKVPKLRLKANNYQI